MVSYSACEVAFAAGFRVRRMPSGTVSTQHFEDGRRPLLEVGPLATAREIVALVGDRLDLGGVIVDGVGLDFAAKSGRSSVECSPAP